MSDSRSYLRAVLDCFRPAQLRAGVRELWHRPPSQVPALDALRSLAVLLVVAHHWWIKLYEQSGGPAIRWPSIRQNPGMWLFGKLAEEGWTGVDLFFVLSGFLIGGMLWRELRREGRIQFPRFFARRAFRIWPLYYAMLAYYSALHVFGGTDIYARWSDLLLVSNYFPAGLARGWSLSTEEHFYITIPLLLIATAPLFRNRTTRHVRLAPFFAVFAVLEVAVLVVRYATMRALHVTADELPPPGSVHVLLTPFHTHLEGLLVGVCIALTAALVPAWFDRKRPQAPAWLGAAGFVVALIATIGFRLANHRLFGFLELGLVYGGLVWFGLLDRSWITRGLMAWRVWYPISRLSYGVYLNHWWALPIANVWGIAVMRLVSDRPGVIFAGSLVIGTCVAMAFALVTFLFVERPGLAARDVFDLRRAGRPVSHAGVVIPTDVRPYPGDRLTTQPAEVGSRR